MKAAVVGASDRLEVIQVPDPVPGPGQVLIDIEASGVGYVDAMARRGDYAPFPGPGAAPGVEVVGIVQSIGAEVPDSLVGQRVLALMSFGGFAERAVADIAKTVPVPAEGAAADIVALGVNALVADVLLDRTEVTARERVLVRGAGGGIGILAVQLAHALGAEVTAVTSSPVRAGRLRALGADHIVDRTEDSPGGTYDVVVDTVAGPELAQHLSLLAANGRYVLCGAAGGAPEPDAFLPMLTNYHNSPTLFAFSLNSVARNELLQSWKRIETRRSESALIPVIDEYFTLDKSEAALHRVEHGGPFGKIVLLPG